jgi:hypothetical protein
MLRVVTDDRVTDFEGDRSERKLLIEVGQHHHLDVHRILWNLYQTEGPTRMKQV